MNRPIPQPYPRSDDFPTIAIVLVTPLIYIKAIIRPQGPTILQHSVHIGGAREAPPLKLITRNYEKPKASTRAKM